MVTAIVERLNEKRRNTLTYLFKDKLDPKYSMDGRWASVLAEYTRVAADVVALDSELPLKSRDSLEVASGSIPKMGMKLYLTEKQMKEVDSMIAQNLPIARIVDYIFNDTPRCIEGIWERLEDIFLSALSTGVGLSARDNGTGVRINMNFYEANQFGVAKLWTADDTAPLDDIQKVVDKSIEDMNTITDAYTDDTVLQALYKNPQVRAQFAFNQGIAMTGTSTVPVLDLDKLSAVFLAKWGIRLHRVSRRVKTESNGVRQNHSPWKQGVITFVCDDKLGSLVWTDVAEATRPVAGVSYQTAEEYILLKKYSTTDPLREFTASEAMVIPVLDNVDRIYTIDSKSLQS
ncbi:MAG: hypothetical protein ACI4SO_05235 [Muribaculaceae bacterium]